MPFSRATAVRLAAGSTPRVRQPRARANERKSPSLEPMSTSSPSVAQVITLQRRGELFEVGSASSPQPTARRGSGGRSPPGRGRAPGSARSRGRRGRRAGTAARAGRARPAVGTHSPVGALREGGTDTGLARLHARHSAIVPIRASASDGVGAGEVVEDLDHVVEHRVGRGPGRRRSRRRRSSRGRCWRGRRRRGAATSAVGRLAQQVAAEQQPRRDLALLEVPRSSSLRLNGASGPHGEREAEPARVACSASPRAGRRTPRAAASPSCRRCEVRAAAPRRSRGSLSSCATPTAACMSVDLQVVADVRVDVLVVVAVRQVAELPVEALAAGVVLARVAPAVAAPVAERLDERLELRPCSVSTAPPSPIVMWWAG